MAFIVTADIKYLDGALEGMTIPAGYRVTEPDRSHANRCSAWLSKVQRSNDFIRAVGTGNRYQIVGPIEVREAA